MIIVIGGVRGSGKDTVGDYLKASHGWHKEAFANPLKEMVKFAFPAFTDEDLYGPSSNRERQYEQYPMSETCPSCGGGLLVETFDTHPPAHSKRCFPCKTYYPMFVSPRVALQTLGTEWGRRLYKDVWIDAAFARLHKFFSESPHRTVVETTETSVSLSPRSIKHAVITDCRFLNEVRGSKRNGAKVVKLTRGLAQSSDVHASEAEFRTIPNSEFDYVLDNANCTLAELGVEIEKMLQAVGARP